VRIIQTVSNQAAIEIALILDVVFGAITRVLMALKCVEKLVFSTRNYQDQPEKYINNYFNKHR